MWWRGGRMVALVWMVLAPHRVYATDAIGGSVLIEAASGRVLAASRGDERYPAGSFADLLVLLLALERAELAQLPLQVPVSVSSVAASAPGSGRHGAALRLRANDTYLLSDLMKATLLAGSGSAAVAVAEAIAGNVPLALEAVNRRASLLGMTSSSFTEIGGVRPGQEAGYASARDLAQLGRALVGHPLVLEWASLKGLPFDQGSVLLRNVNPMIGTASEVDGLYVAAGSSSLGVIATAERNSLRLIVALVGAKGGPLAFRQTVDLLDWGFARYRRVEIIRRGERLKVSVRVEEGSVASVVPVAGESVSLLKKISEDEQVVLRYQLPESIVAPVAKGDQVGEVILEQQGRVVGVVPVLSPVTVSRSSQLSVAAR